GRERTHVPSWRLRVSRGRAAAASLPRARSRRRRDRRRPGADPEARSPRGALAAGDHSHPPEQRSPPGGRRPAHGPGCHARDGGGDRWRGAHSVPCAGSRRRGRMIVLDIESGASAHAPSCGCSVPETVLPGQFYATLRSQRTGERERVLMLAVLEDAITCYQRYARAGGPAARQLFEDARAWLESEDRSVLFSFESICDALEISPGFVRRRLHEWNQRHVGSCGTRRDRDPSSVSPRRPERTPAQWKAVAGPALPSGVGASRATGGPSTWGSPGFTRC